MKELPNKRSELIKVAIADLELVEKDKNYTLNMDQWHVPIIEDFNLDFKSCAVCLAVAVMAKSLDCDINRRIYPDKLGIINNSKLHILEYILFLTFCVLQ